MNEDVQKSRGNRLNKKREAGVPDSKPKIVVYTSISSASIFYASEDFYYYSITF